MILLVEDNPEDCELTLRALNRTGLSNPVQTASDGAEALEILFGAGSPNGAGSEFRPAIVLLDLKLPKLGGLELLDAIKRDPRTCTIPVIVLTSSREETDIEAAYHRGANSYIVKPVDFEEFGAAIAQLANYWLNLNERPC